MRQNALTDDEKRIIIKEKEKKEIIKWEKEKAKPKRPYYLFYLMLLIAIVYITDEVASQIGTQMKTEIANSIFITFGNSSVSVMDTIGTIITLIATLGALLYKPLSDKLGRKLFLVINTFGMGIGMFIIFLSNYVTGSMFGIIVYVLGALTIGFFVPNDMQVVYIMETTPPAHRAKIYSIIKAFATLGVMLIPILRRTFMTTTSQWNMVFLIPAIIGMIIAVVCLLGSRETDPFIDRRLSYLKMTDEERLAVKKEKDAKDAQGGVKAAFKFAFQHKQLRWLFIVSIFLGFGYLITMYYEVTMAYGYGADFLRQGLYTTLEEAEAAASVGVVTTALFMFPIASAAFQFINGFIADKWGRKPAAIVMASISLITFVLFYVGADLGWTPYAVGLLCGASVGSYWATGDIVSNMMVAESSPTNLRASIMTVRSLISLLGTGPAYILGLVLIGAFGNQFTGIVSLLIAVPGMALSLVLLMLKSHETKGLDLDKITGCEWNQAKTE